MLNNTLLNLDFPPKKAINLFSYRSFDTLLLMKKPSLTIQPYK